MHLRWLFGNFSDPQYGLDREDQKRLSQVAHEKYMPRRRFMLVTLLALLVPVLLLLKFGLPSVLQWLGLSGRTGPYLVGIAIILVLFWIWSAWVYHIAYTKPMRRAMRENGLDLCVECGYLLTGLDDDSLRCPECGARSYNAPPERDRSS